MKNPLWKLILLLLISFIVLSVYAFSDFKLSILSYNIEKANIESYQLIRKQKNELTLQKDTLIKDTISEISETNQCDTSKQRILVIGDSMLEGLMFRLKEISEHNHHYLKPVVWYSSSTKWYGSCDTITHFIKKFNPTYLIFVIGANELFIRDIIKKRSKYVKNILKQADTLRYVWVGPPNWKDDTGINELIKQYVDENQFYESRKLHFNRSKDGAHPTRESASMWGDSIATWIMNKSRYPIRFNLPDTLYTAYPNPVILQPK